VRRIEVTDQSRRIAPGRIDEGVELELVHGLQDGVSDLVAIGFVGFAGRRARAVLGPFISHLEAALGRGVKAPGFDDVGQALQWDAAALGGEVAVDVVLEAHAGAGVLWAPDRVEPFDGCRVGDGRASAA